MKANLTPLQTGVETLLKSYGSSCKIEKVDGTTVSATGVLMSSTSKDTNADSFITSNMRNAYVSGKIKVVPEEGDTITFTPNTYVITEVKALALGEGQKNVFAYKLTVGT